MADTQDTAELRDRRREVRSGQRSCIESAEGHPFAGGHGPVHPCQPETIHEEPLLDAFQRGAWSRWKALHRAESMYPLLLSLLVLPTGARPRACRPGPAGTSRVLTTAIRDRKMCISIVCTN